MCVHAYMHVCVTGTRILQLLVIFEEPFKGLTRQFSLLKGIIATVAICKLSIVINNSFSASLHLASY